VQQVDAGLHISSAAPSKCPSSAVSRGSSTPPTGTTKADDAAGAAAKARAVAALQHLFFEEMQKNGQDANEAAARALLRLSEVPTSQTARSTTPSSEDRVEVAAAHCQDLQKPAHLHSIPRQHRH